MSPQRKDMPPDFDEDFQQAVAQWREQYKLREDDAALMLIELFRIHQRHWDEFRRREMPSFNQFRSDIASLVESAKQFQQQAAALMDALKGLPQSRGSASVTFGTAVSTAFAFLLAGYLIGRAWP